MTTGTYTNAVILTNASSATGTMQTIQSTAGALYSTGTNTKPAFGTLPVSYGGTGATTLSSGYALIGKGTNAIGTRSVISTTVVINATYSSENLTLTTSTVSIFANS